MKLPLDIDCWLAHRAAIDISPRAYKQNEVVRALNGTTIEVMHTDAEGRMVLADTLTLAARGKPGLIVDFATLTGSMHVALGDRYSGIFATSDELAAQAVAAGTGVRASACAHFRWMPITTARSTARSPTSSNARSTAKPITSWRHVFSSASSASTPWIHVDLSASSCKGGLGAVASDITGFGVGWALELLAPRGLHKPSIINRKVGCRARACVADISRLTNMTI